MRLEHYVAWALSSGGTLIDGLSVFMLGVAIPLLTRDLGLSTLQTGLLGAALVAGAAAGAVVGGRLADRVGRKAVFLLDMSVLALAAVVSALTWSTAALIVAQMAVGVGIGMDFPVSGSYVAECTPHRRRSRMMVATIACQSVGLLLAALLAMALLSLAPSVQTWRWFFGVEALAATLFLLGRLNLPESPRWLMGQGRNREAVRMLERFVPEDRRELEKMASRLGDTVHYVARVPRSPRPLGLATLFHPTYLRSTLLSTVPWFLMDIATYGVGLFTAVLLAELHVGGAGLPLVEDVAGLVRGMGLIDTFLLLGFALGIWAISRFGRIRMQLIGFAGMAGGMGILLAGTLLLGGTGRAYIVVVFGGFVMFNLFMNMGPNSTTFILPTELYPTQVRATGAGFAATVAKLGATLGVFALPLVKSALGVAAVLGLMALISVLGLLSTWAFGIFGHGLTLEEHQTKVLPTRRPAHKTAVSRSS
jgi:predicted MFS family arabinose efflux permease